jgi:predicted membrane channel-forming protein YqfA (hemolysin III family)
MINSNIIIVLVALSFYVPTIVYLVRNGHSWAGMLVVGIVTTILGIILNQFVPPWGAVLYAAVHVLFVSVGGFGLREERRDRQPKGEQD